MFGAMSVREKIVLGLLAALLLAGAAWRFWRPSQPVVEPMELKAESERQEVEPELITVHAVGAVNQPGVYSLPEGSRVYELLERAGGPTPEADLEAVNLARPLSDGEQVHFTASGNPPPAKGGASGKVNINRATAAELETLPGIGPTRARALWSTAKYGYFKDITEIMDVSGIGEGIYETLKDHITVY